MNSLMDQIKGIAEAQNASYMAGLKAGASGRTLEILAWLKGEPHVPLVVTEALAKKFLEPGAFQQFAERGLIKGKD